MKNLLSRCSVALRESPKVMDAFSSDKKTGQHDDILNEIKAVLFSRSRCDHTKAIITKEDGALRSLTPKQFRNLNQTGVTFMFSCKHCPQCGEEL